MHQAGEGRRRSRSAITARSKATRPGGRCSRIPSGISCCSD
jgi:hypothetical protein